MKKVAILGWGLDTQDVEPYLRKRGYEITVYDRNSNDKIQNSNQTQNSKIKWVLGNEDFGDLSQFDMIVRSPGVYRYRPEIVAAEKAGVEITSKTKLFFDVCPAKIIGVTGTKGKGTTSTLIYEMLKAGGKKVYMGGNIGTGVFQYLDKLTAESWVVLELSSFQLIDLTKSPHIAVVLMTTIDHLDWHKDADDYVRAKLPIANYQLPIDWTVANKDYENSRKIGEMGKGQKVWVSRADWQWPTRLRGEHNKENLAAAAAAARAAGVNDKVIKQVGAEFKGLEHRLEEVATVNGVTYFDDSFSTAPETTMAAIETFEEPKVLILGGSEKGSDFTELGVKVSKCKSVRGVIVIGEMAGRIKAAIGEGVKILEGAKNMQEIFEQAKSLVQPGDVVLLSPACASFGMFKNYKDRGNQFKAEVLKLKGD